MTNARTGKPFALPHVHQVFGDEREVLDEAYPGDVVGAVNAGELRVGDTLYDGPPVRFEPIPTLAPEHFATARNRDTSRHKQFHRGLQQLGEEGVVHVLRRGQGRIRRRCSRASGRCSSRSPWSASSTSSARS